MKMLDLTLHFQMDKNLSVEILKALKSPSKASLQI